MRVVFVTRALQGMTMTPIRSLMHVDSAQLTPSIHILTVTKIPAVSVLQHLIGATQKTHVVYVSEMEHLARTVQVSQTAQPNMISVTYAQETERHV